MKSFVAAGALLAALASAQSIADLPSCSLTCIVNGVTAVGCSATDFTCSCDAADKLAASVTPCVQSACSAADQAKVITVLEGICASVGIPITLSPGGATSSAAPASSSAAPASSSEAAPASSSAAAPASYSSAAAPASSSACSTSTTYTTVTASSGPYPTYGSNGTVTTAPPAPAYTGAASSNSAVFGAAGLFGLLAYIL